MIGMGATSTANFHDHAFEMPAWKSITSHVAAVIMGVIFLATGIAKMAVPFLVQQLFDQLLVPVQFSLPLVILLGIGETLGGILILIPKYRRWGAWLISGLLVAFMLYIGIRYNALVGRDCSCFPWLKRTVNAAFFAEDGAMLVLSLLAAGFSIKPASLKTPLVMLLGIAVLAGGAYGYNVAHQSGIQVPETITVDGKPFNLHQGHVFLFFYDPSCSHCNEAAEHMSTYHWKSDVTVIGLPTNDPQWAASFLHDTKLKALTSNDTAALRKLFVFNYPPYGVALDTGHVRGIVQHYDLPEPETSLRQLGYID